MPGGLDGGEDVRNPEIRRRHVGVENDAPRPCHIQVLRQGQQIRDAAASGAVSAVVAVKRAGREIFAGELQAGRDLVGGHVAVLQEVLRRVLHLRQLGEGQRALIERVAGPAGDALLPVVGGVPQRHVAGLHVADIALGGRPHHVEVAEPVHGEGGLELSCGARPAHPPELLDAAAIVPVRQSGSEGFSRRVGHDGAVPGVAEALGCHAEAVAVPDSEGLRADLHWHVLAVEFVLVGIVWVEPEREGVRRVRASGGEGPGRARRHAEVHHGRAGQHEAPDVELPAHQMRFVELQIAVNRPVRIDEQNGLARGGFSPVHRPGVGLPRRHARMRLPHRGVAVGLGDGHSRKHLNLP